MQKRQILHIDVNNAFLSWTALDMLKKGSKMDIRTIPAIIGGDEKSRHGIVLAKSMVAKQFGIKTAEPIYFARKKCPELKVFPSNFKIYNKYSNALYEMFLEYTEKVERFSIDECFLDLTDCLPKGTTLLDIAYEINKRVKEELEFSVNIGISNNKLLAKMASDFEKPDKVHTLYPEEIQNKMWKLPASELFMVGKKTLPKLENLGIKTIEDVAKYNKEKLIKYFGKHGKLMWEYANGIDDTKVEYEDTLPKGIGNSITLSYDISEIEKLNEILLTLCDQVCYRLRQYKLKAKVVNVQIKTDEFINYSHQKSFGIPIDSTKQIYEVAKELLKNLHKGRKIRLLGLRVDKLYEKNEMQLSLFATKEDIKQEKLDQTIDQIKEKYGRNLITRAGKMKLNEKIKFKEE